MTSSELIKAGKLSEARSQLIEEVKAAPGDLGKRTTLCQIQCFGGEWDKAERQLDVITTQDPQREAGVQAYKNLIQVERERPETARLERRPTFLPKEPHDFNDYLAIRKKISEENITEAQDLMEKMESRAPVLSGTVNGEPFTGFFDTDSYLTDFLETVVHERYIWISFQSIRELIISPPRNLFDLLWIPANITLWDGMTLNCYLPVIYPESSADDNELIKMGRMTEWGSLGGPFARGMGQHVYQVGDTDMAILDIREVVFNPLQKGTEET